ncbi:hypothetical protein JXA56_01575 [Candidatus Micrarchaeota archaeon]|nr:hypothetical protein [Candidatus Micrarchaeota archaeon]
METSKNSYIAQTTAYLKNKNYEKAYSCAKELLQAFPGEMVGHYLASASAFWLKKYDESALEAKRAFNKASGDDMIPCAIMAATAYYELSQYDKGMEILRFVENRKMSEGIERLMFIFSLAKNDGREAAVHLNELYRLNEEAAREMLIRYLG